MAKFVIAAWVFLFTVVACTQIFDFWRIDTTDGVKLASFCEGMTCRSERYSARVFYLYGDADRVLIRDSADIEVGCGVEKATHLKARSVWRGGSVDEVRGRDRYDRNSQRQQIVNDLSVFLPCDAPADASAFGVAVSTPVWLKQMLANARTSLGVTAATFDVRR